MSSFSYYQSELDFDRYYRQISNDLSAPQYSNRIPFNNRYSNGTYFYENNKSSLINDQFYANAYNQATKKNTLYVPNTSQYDLDPFSLKEIDELEKILRQMKSKQSKFICIKITNYQFFSVYPLLLSKFKRELKFFSSKSLKMELSVEKEEEIPGKHQLITQFVKAKCGPSGKITYKLQIKSTIAPFNFKNIFIKLVDNYVEIYRQTIVQDEREEKLLTQTQTSSSSSNAIKNEINHSLIRQEVPIAPTIKEKISSATFREECVIEPKKEKERVISELKQEKVTTQEIELSADTFRFEASEEEPKQEIIQENAKNLNSSLINEIESSQEMIKKEKDFGQVEFIPNEVSINTLEENESFIFETRKTKKEQAKPKIETSPVFDRTFNEEKHNLNKRTQPESNSMQRHGSINSAKMRKKIDESDEKPIAPVEKLSSSSFYSIDTSDILLGEPDEYFESSIISEYDFSLQKPRRLSQAFSMSLEKISETSDSQADLNNNEANTSNTSVLRESKFNGFQESPSFEELESLCQNETIDNDTLKSLISISQPFELLNTRRPLGEHIKPKNILNLIAADDDFHPKMQNVAPKDETRTKIDKIMRDFDSIISKFETCYSKSSSMNKIDTLRDAQQQINNQGDNNADENIQVKKEFLITNIENLCRPNGKDLHLRDVQKPKKEHDSKKPNRKNKDFSMHSSRGRDRKTPSPRSLSYSRYLHLIKM